MTIKVTYNVTDVYMSQSVSPVYINVSYSDGGASGGGVWGTITGTLSNQTDLQNALNAKLDEFTIDGGTEGQILSKASGTDFDFAWINNYAKYLATNVRNQTGSTIGAFQVVYISGATGNKPLISLADADTEATSSKTYGVTATSIANNSTGDVVTAGELSGIDTSALNEGDLLWLSTTAGGVVTSPPAEPAHAVFIGYVVRSHPTLGVIDVAIANGYELNELHGVQITSAANNDGLFYNSTSTLWENKSITTALGYTPVPTTRNITINGVTYDLSADRTYTISTGISGSGASGQVTYWTGASAVSGSSVLTHDAALRTLKITGATGNYILDLTNTANSTAFRFEENAVLGAGVQYIGSTFSVANRRQYLELIGTNGIAFRSTGAELARFNGSNLLLNGTTDNGQRLQVYGDTLLRGSGNTSATTALTVQNSSSTNLFVVRNDGNVGIGTNAPITQLNVNQVAGTTKGLFISGDEIFATGNGATNKGIRIALGVSRSGNRQVWIGDNDAFGSSTLSIFRYQTGQTGYASLDSVTGDGVTRLLTTIGTETSNVGIGYDSTTPTSALYTAKLNVFTFNTANTNLQIRKFGTATGNYLDIVNTSGTNVFQIKSDGKVNISSLPTSSTGLVAGDLWNDAGTIKIV